MYLAQVIRQFLTDTAAEDFLVILQCAEIRICRGTAGQAVAILDELDVAQTSRHATIAIRSSRWMWRFSTFSITGRIRRTSGALVFWFLSFIIVLLTFRSLGLHRLAQFLGLGDLLCHTIRHTLTEHPEFICLFQP